MNAQSFLESNTMIITFQGSGAPALLAQERISEK